MKKTIVFLVLSTMLFACSKDQMIPGTPDAETAVLAERGHGIRPFRSHGSGFHLPQDGNPVCEPPTIEVGVAGTGVGTLVGQSEVYLNGCFDPNTFTVIGQATVVSADGDILVQDYTSHYMPPQNPNSTDQQFVINWTVNGELSTGKFAHIGGHGTGYGTSYPDTGYSEFWLEGVLEF